MIIADMTPNDLTKTAYFAQSVSKIPHE